jgi:regulator of sigma E protease
VKVGGGLEMDFLLFLVILGGLIIGHELGHFLMSRLVGIQVREFGIGFPPRLAKVIESKGTEYTINAIPFGGFVRIAGEDDPSVEGGLAGAKKRVRAAVLLAGPAANILLAILAFILAFRFAMPDTERVLISEVQADTPAAAAGMKPGDLVLSVEGQTINGFQSLQQAIAEQIGLPTQIELQRDGRTLSVELVPRKDFPEDQGPIGVVLGYPLRQVTWPEAIGYGFQTTYLQFNEIIHLPAKLVRGEVQPSEARISGLKGIYDMIAWAASVDRSAERPFVTLNLVGVISIGLALANLLPFPALDGGRMMFIGIEIMLGRRINPKYESLAHALGFILLLALMVYINLQDFINPISLPR